MTEKRRRGRPAGTQINDEAALANVADLLVASPGMKLSAALEAVRKAGKYKGQSDRAVEERWRTKFKDRRTDLMEAAANRRATKEARPTSGRANPTGIGYGVSLASFKNPLHDPSSAIGAVVARTMANPLQDAIAQATRNSVQDAVDALQRYTTPLHDAAQRATDQLQATYSLLGYAPHGQIGYRSAYDELMLRVEEQRRLNDRIEEQQRLTSRIEEHRRIMNEIEKHQRIMDQINITNRWDWPHR